jgi:vacuolar-type H+-ATPase subunit H
LRDVEVIEAIRRAESEGEAIIEQAKAEATAIIRRAKARAEKIVADAEAESDAERTEIVKKAEEEGLREGEIIRRDAELIANKLKEEASQNMEEAISKIVKLILAWR